MSKKVFTALLLPLLLAAGCSTVPREAGFPEVAKDVSDRTGTRVHWNQGSEADLAVATEVTELLGRELTVDEAVQIALLNNRNLQATYSGLSLAQADLVSAGLLRNPIFDAEVKFVEGGGGTGLELAVVQDFIDILYIPLRKRLAEAAFESAKLNVVGAVMDLSAQVRAAFFNYQSAEQTLEMRRQVLEATEAGYDIAKRLRAAGNFTELELFNERALYEQVKINVRASELAVLRGRERLNALLGLWGSQTRWTVAKRLPEIPAEEVPADVVEARAIERSLDLAIARQEVEQSGRALGIARPFSLFPEAELGAAAEREPEGEWAVGPAFSLPIPLFNQGQPGVVTAQAGLRSSLERYAATAVTLRSQARTAHAAVVAARDKASYYAKILLPLRARIVEQTQLHYNAMQVGPIQLLAAKQEQIDAGTAYIEALRDYWVARSELDQILNGRMTSFEASAAEGTASQEAPRGREGGH